MEWTDFKSQFTDQLTAQGIEHCEWDDAVSISFSDGFDDLWITMESLDLIKSEGLVSAEILKEYHDLDQSRERILRALRHAAIAHRLHLEKTQTGDWGVHTMDGASWGVEVGEQLTTEIREKGEIEAFRRCLKETVSSTAGIQLLQMAITTGVHIWQKKYLKALKAAAGGVAAGLGRSVAKLYKRPPQASWPDERLAKWLNGFTAPPDNELTWKQYEALTEEDEDEEDEDEVDLAESVPMIGDIAESVGGVMGMFQQPIKDVSLPFPDPKVYAEVDVAADKIFTKLYREMEKNSRFYPILDSLFFQPEKDTWVDRERVTEVCQKLMADATGDNFYARLSAAQVLIKLGDDSVRPELENMVTDWYNGGGHDLWEERDLLNLFPDHEATKELIDSRDQDPERSLRARSYYLREIESAFSEFRSVREERKDHALDLSQNEVLEDYDAEHWSSALDDVLDPINRLSPKWAKLLVPPNEQAYLHSACMEVVELPGGQLRFLHDDILKVCLKFNWLDIAQALRNHPAYAGLLFGNMISSDDLWGAVAPLGKDKTKPDYCCDVYDFREPLLHWSLLCPDNSTLQLAYAAMLRIQKGRAELQDQLGAAVAWSRCR